MTPAPMMDLRELLNDASAPQLACAGLSVDSRTLQPGEVFVALAGTRSHGLAHVAQAQARGAVAVLWEPSTHAPALPDALPAMAIPALTSRLGGLAARFYGQPSQAVWVVGVTGTDGKTSTAHLVAQGLNQLGVRCGYLGTIGYGLLDQLDEASHTTPDAVRVQQRLAGLRAMGAQACAMEVSSHALDQHRVAGMRFGAAVLTNVGRDHLDYHGDVEAYAAAKQRLFTVCAPQHRILNQDDDCGARWADGLTAALQPPESLTRYSLAPPTSMVPQLTPLPLGQHQLYAERVISKATGLQLELRADGQAAVLESRLLGRFNAANLLAALAVMCRHGAPLADAVAALSAAHTVPGRMEAYYAADAAAGPTVVVDYAHTPQALNAALQAVRPHVQGRLICVFGCGGDRDRGKRPLMGAAVAQLADAAIITDDNPRSEDPAVIVSEILAGIANEQRDRFQIEHDRAQAIRRAVLAGQPGDLVLIAGKGHERDQDIGGVKRPFSDRETVARLLGLAYGETAATAQGVSV